MPPATSPNQKLLRISAWALALTALVKIAIALLYPLPMQEELDAVDGVIQGVVLGGDGNPTTLLVRHGERDEFFRTESSFLWPGLEFLKEGDDVKLLASPSLRKRLRLSGGGHARIWHLEWKGRILIQFDDVRRNIEAQKLVLNLITSAIVVICAGAIVFASVKLKNKNASAPSQKDLDPSPQS